MSPEPAIQLYSLTELRAADVPSPEPIVEGLIYAGDTVLLVGRPKVGKSRLVQQLTLSLSRGEPWLGKTIHRPSRVLLLDLENRASGVKSRFTAMSTPGEAVNVGLRKASSSAPAGQLTEQPRFGYPPVACHSFLGNLHNLGRFLNAKTTEKP